MNKPSNFPLVKGKHSLVKNKSSHFPIEKQTYSGETQPSGKPRKEINGF